MPLYPCAVCGTLVEMPWAWRKRHKYVFCSDKCQNTPFITIPCAQCGKPFNVTAQAAPQAKFCSAACRNARNRNGQVHKRTAKITKICQQCGKEFDVRRSFGKSQIFCSKACFHASGKLVRVGADNSKWKEKITVVCAYCGKEFQTFPSRNGRSKYCCRAHSIIGNLSHIAQQPRTNIERAMADALKKNRIGFDEQVILFGKFMVDFKLSDYPIIIQCDGTYWHDRPNTKSRDKGQDAYLTKVGFVVLRFNDSQILKDISGCIRVIKATIRNPSQPPLVNY